MTDDFRRRSLEQFFEEAPSNLFEEAFIQYGETYAECDFCGKSYAAFSESFDTEEEFKKSFDENTILWYDVSAVEVMVLGSKEAVAGCDCHAGKRFETFIWNNRHRIMNYLKSRIDVINDHSEQEKTLLRLIGDAK